MAKGLTTPGEDREAPTHAGAVATAAGVEGPLAGDAGWVGVVANRSSGIGRGLVHVERLVDELGRVDLRSEVVWSPQERAALVDRAAGDPRCRCLVAVGGDGTVSALINERPRVPMTVLPAGTENLVAQHFGLRRNPKRLARIVAAARSYPIDVGVAAGRRFLLMAGFGFDGDVVTRHHRGRIARSGQIRPTNRMAYVEPILRSSFSYQFPDISVQIVDPAGGEVLRGTTVFVFNLPRYALGLPFVPGARDDDGLLDLLVFREPGPFRALHYLWKVFCGSHFNDPSVYHRRVKKVIVTADGTIPVQLDGDPGGCVSPDDGGSVPSARVNGAHGAAVTRGGLVGNVSAWTVEVLPSAIQVIPAKDRHHGPVRVPLATDRLTR